MNDCDELKFIPDCEHCEENLILKENGVKLFTNEKPNFAKTQKSRSVFFNFKDSKCKIVGRLIYTKNGNFLFLQDTNYIDNSSPRFLLTSCEISGYFKSSIMLQCKKTKSSIISCWISVRDWYLLEVKTSYLNAPLRSALLDNHIHPYKENLGNVLFLRNKLLCFNASTVIWLSSKIPKVFPMEINIKSIDIVGLVSHISAVIKYKTEKDQNEDFNLNCAKDQIKKFPETSKTISKFQNLEFQKNTYFIDKILKASEKCLYNSNFSIIVTSIFNKEEFVILFPGIHLLIYRYVLGWKHIYKFENIVPASILLHEIGEEPKKKNCYIATKSTIIQIEPTIRNNLKLPNENLILTQVEKVLGFGVFELKTKQISIRLFLHNSSYHEVSLGCSISKGSIFWLRNFRVINIKVLDHYFIPIGIAIEPFSDCGLNNHSNFLENSNEKKTIWDNQPLHIQTIGHEFLELSNFFYRKFNTVLLNPHPWDIRNYCYYHYSLYVDLFNIIGFQSDEYQILPVLLVQIISNKEIQSPVLITANREIIYSNGKIIAPNSSSLNCIYEPQHNFRITHPSQNVELKSKKLKLYPINCENSQNEFWKIATIEEWLNLINYFISTKSYDIINFINFNRILPIEFLYYIKKGFSGNKHNFQNEKKQFDSNITFSIRCSFMIQEENQNPLFIGFYGQFLAELVIDKSMESNYWISNALYIKTPSLHSNLNNIYFLFVNNRSKLDILLNKRLYGLEMGKNFIFIKKSIIRYYNEKISFFANDSDIIFIHFEKNTKIQKEKISFKNENEGVLLFIKSKEVINTESGCKFYFNCLFFFSSSRISKDYNEYNKYNFLNSRILRIPVSSNWYFYTNPSTFLIITKNPIKKKIILSLNQERIFVEEMTQMNFHKFNYFIQELKFPNFLSSETFNIKPDDSFIEIKLINNQSDSVFWPLSNKLPLYFKIENANSQNESFFIFEIKYWIENIMEWLLLNLEKPLIYRFINTARMDIMEFYFEDHCFNKNNTSEVALISLENVRILDIKQFWGCNPQGKYCKWSILKVTTNQKPNLANKKLKNFCLLLDPPWSSGWIDIWFSEEDLKSHNIQFLSPGETISISNIKITRIKQTGPLLSSISDILNSIICRLNNHVNSNKSLTSTPNDYTITLTEKKNNIYDSFGTPIKSKFSTSIFNNGSILFKSAIQNNIYKLNLSSIATIQNKDTPINPLLFNYLYFSISPFSEITLFYEYEINNEHMNEYQIKQLKYKDEVETIKRDNKTKNNFTFNHFPYFPDPFEHKYNYYINNFPNPYILAPDGTPITLKFISWARNNHLAFIGFSKAYCLHNEINVDLQTEISSSFNKFFENPIENSILIDPEVIFCLQGSILHIEQINSNWLCFKCLKTIKGLVKCSCGIDHSKNSKWTSLCMYLIGVVEIYLPELRTKIFPFVMTNWNVIKLLAFSKNFGTQSRDHKDLYNQIIETADIIWNHMSALKNIADMEILYCFGEQNNKIFSSSTSHIYSDKTLKDQKPSGIIGNMQIFDNRNVEIPNDPISNIDFEACIRFNQSSGSNVLTNSYIHVLRWKPRNVRKELEEKLAQIDLMN